MSSGSSGPAHWWAACSQRSRTRLWFAETAGARSGRDSMPTLTLVAERTPIKAYELTTSAVNIGRGEDMDIVIDNVSVSGRKARVQPAAAGRWVVEALSSANGTYDDGDRLPPPRPLPPGHAAAC